MLPCDTAGSGSAPDVAVPLSATSSLPSTVFTQKRRMPLRDPSAVGLNRSSAVQLSPAASAAAVVHVPPASKTKSDWLTLAAVMPRAANCSGPAPLFVTVTVVGADV